MEAKKSNKIREIVKLQQILKKWRKVAHASKQANNNKIDNEEDNNNNNNNNGSGNGSKSIKFLKRTLSFTDATAVPKGYLSVSVGLEKKRYTIPTESLSHQAFHVLVMTSTTAKQECRFNAAADDKTNYRHPSDCPRTPSHQPHSHSPMCR